MKTYLKSPRSRMLLALLGLTLATAWAVSAVLNVQDKSEVKSMTRKMKTVCVGRFLIDLPENARVSLRPAFLEGFDISTRPHETEQEFTERLAARETEIRSEPNELGGDNLEAESAINRDKIIGKTFAFGRTRSYVFHGTERVNYENVALNGYVHANGVSFDFIANGYDPDHIDNLAKLIGQLKPLAENEIPTEPGFCIDKGLILDPLTADQHERVVMFAGLPGHPDLAIAFDTTAGLNPSKSLLSRDANNSVKLAYLLHFKNLRAGVRSINGIPGEELLEKIREGNFTTGFSFTWESISKKNDVFLPALSLELSTGHGQRQGGGPVNSSLSDGALLDLWDKISSSVRLRPTRPPEAADAGPVIPQLGTFVSANQACPVSGWWQCLDSGDFEVQGGKTQYFRGGERVPQTVLLGPPNLWQRIKHEQPGFQRATDTRWKLVDRRQRARTGPVMSSATSSTVTPEKNDRSNTARPAPKIGPDEVARVRVGTLVGTGLPCPESGWWICPERGALDGARWFTHGELLPTVRFNAARTWLARLKGEPAAQLSRSVWQLARYDPTPSSLASAACADQDERATPRDTNDGANTSNRISHYPNQET